MVINAILDAPGAVVTTSTRPDNLTDTYAEARTGLDQLTELLVDLDELYNKCEPAERRILNRALFTRITSNDAEDATYTPEQTTASVLTHTSIDAPAHVTAETKLPRHQAGQVSNFSTYVEPRGLEPLTPCLQSRCATNCAKAPCVWSMNPRHRLCHPSRGSVISSQRSRSARSAAISRQMR